MISDSSLIKQWQDHKKRTERGLAYQYRMIREEFAFHAGDKMYYSASVTDGRRKAMVIFNKVKPFVSAVRGFMIQLRRKPEYQARIEEAQDQQARSQYMNGVSDYARDNANADQEESVQDNDMLICGIGAVETNLLWERDPNGEIAWDRIDPADVGWDPMARKGNLLDARWVFRKKKYTQEEALDLFPGSKEEDFQASDGSTTNAQFFPNGGVVDKIAFDTDNSERGLVNIYYYQWWEREKYYRCKNPIYDIQDPQLVNILANGLGILKQKRQEISDEYQVEDLFSFDPTGEYLVMNSLIKNDVMAFFMRFGIEIEVVENTRRCYYTAILSGSEVFTKFKSPDQNGFTIKFKTGEYDKENNRWFGMVASLKEPGRYFNKALTEILYVIASNSKGGVLYEKSAVEDKRKFEQQYLANDSAVEVADGAISGGRIRDKASAALPTGYENILQVSSDAMPDVVGINPEFLGSSENKQVSALLESQRIKQVCTTLASYFDAISLYQKENARLCETFIKMLAQQSEGRLIRILGPEGAKQFVPLMMDKLASEYDIEIGEAPTTPAQKQEQQQTMMTLAQTVASMGINLYPVAVKYLDIKQADIQQILQIMEPQPDPLAEQQKKEMDQLMLEGKKAEVQKAMADATNETIRIGLFKGDQILQNKHIEIRDIEKAQALAEKSKIQAEAAKTFSQAQQINIENEIALKAPIKNVSLSI